MWSSPWRAALAFVICAACGGGLAMLVIYIGKHWDDPPKS